LHTTCSIKCALVEATKQREKKEKCEAKASRKELKEYREKNRTTAQWIKLAQPVFNRFIRLRDHAEPCISCGRFDWEIDEKLRGGKWDCGHFLTVGAFPELRFEETNAHKQCKSCNGGSGKYTRKNHTVGLEYRERLIERIGLEKVELLEGPHPPKNYIIDDVKKIKSKYAKLANELQKALE